MFFDDATKRKPAGKVQLRLAADNGLEGGSMQGAPSQGPDASSRHRAARLRREPPAPSLLDQIDAISERQATAEREERLRAADLAAEMEELADIEAAEAHERRLHSAANWQAETSTAKQYQSREPSASSQPQQAENQESRIPQVIYSRPSQDENDSAPLIDPRYVFRSVRNWRALIAATTILGGLAGVYIALNTPHLYFSSATIVVDPRNYKVIENDLNPDVFLSEAALAIVDSQVSLMRSPRVLEKVAARLKLANDPEFNGSKKRGIGSFLGILTSSKVEDYQGGALKYLAEHMSAERSPKTFVVNVGAYSEDPEKAALIANAIVDVYLEEQATTQSDLAKRTSGELGSRLDNLKSEVEKAENKVEAFKSENNLVGAQGRLIEDEEILRVNDQLTAARATTITLNSRAQSAKSATVEAVASGGLPEEVASAGLTALRSQYVAARQRRDGLAAKLGPMHPDLKQADSEIASLTGAINGEINRIRLSIQTDLKRAVETEQQLAARLAQVKVRQGGSGEAQVQLRELEREAATARTVYEQYLLRTRETGEQGNINANNVQKISEARPSDAPEGASRKFIVLGSAIAGFVAGLGLTIAKGMFDALQVRFTSGNGQDAPAPLAPQSPNGRPSGSGARRRMGKIFSAANQKLPAWPSVRDVSPAPQPATNWQQPVPFQPPLTFLNASQQPAYQPPPQSHAVPAFAGQPIMQPHPIQQFVQPAFFQQPVMQPYASPQPSFATIPVQQHQQPQFAQVFVPQPPLRQPVQMQQIAQQSAPQMMQPSGQPAHPQWQPEPVMAAPYYVQQPIPAVFRPVQTQTFLQPQSPVQMHEPIHFAHQPEHSPQPVSGARQPQPQHGDIQGSLNELRAELLDIARRRRSA